MTSKRTNEPTRPSKRNTHDNKSNLDSRYGSIGISAVAAALQFKRDVKKPVQVPASTPDDEKHPGMAA